MRKAVAGPSLSRSAVAVFLRAMMSALMLLTMRCSFLLPSPPKGGEGEKRIIREGIIDSASVKNCRRVRRGQADSGDSTSRRTGPGIDSDGCIGWRGYAAVTVRADHPYNGKRAEIARGSPEPRGPMQR